MAPIQWSMEEGSQNAGGSHPRRCVTDWDFCVTTKQETNHVLFVATTKPASPFTVGCLSPQRVCLGLNLLAFHSSPVSPWGQVSVLHPSLAEQCWCSAKTRRKEAERISRMCAVTRTETVWHVTTHTHPPQRVQELPVDQQVCTASVPSIPSLQPGFWPQWYVAEELQRAFWC